MALTNYLTQTQRLLQNPAAPTSLYSDTDLVSYINTARSQLAGESESIRYLASLPLLANSPTYGFSSITIPGGIGIRGVLNVRMLTLVVSGGQQTLHAWPWEWFNRYFISQVNIAPTAPTDWAQYGQGGGGSLLFYPTPDTAYTVYADTVCYPIDLTDDSTVEAIPYPWTDCVPYFAAYLALLSAQSQARQADANRMFERYEEFVARARRMSTATVLPSQYLQTPEIVPPTSASKQMAKG